ncbi:tipa, putative [Entamoeba invadens IP1]|uniref:Tipa, putative n=1 Tax=Entamoeba invadens IP1 TaxID=370355 RepID=A0A0A1TZA5_ENTIV|nr:tipa, putative [Entamoeba invadens IP1]ELP83846.1 tipa, putative [Entamoeba invadens IP1]|eukprot:XP_004183192.1 tipa, putative [Entamoeba invadens IP1]
MADGAGWGLPSFLAATSARDKALEYFTDNIDGCQTLRDVGNLLVEVCVQSHLAIFRPDVQLFMTGTTTLCIVVVLQTVKGPYMVFLSIGDTRVYYYSKQHHHTTTLSGKYHDSISHMHECFGRIGPANSCEPDIKRGELKHQKVCEDDIIIVATDGLHDNFDPQFRGIKYKSKDKEVDKKMTELIEDDNTTDVATNVVLKMSEFVVNLTEPLREFQRLNPGKKLPTDSKEYKGKMDHVSVCVVVVVDYSKKVVNTQLPQEFVDNENEVTIFTPEFNSKICDGADKKDKYPVYHKKVISTPIMKEIDVMRSESAVLASTSSLGFEEHAIGSFILHDSPGTTQCPSPSFSPLEHVKKNQGVVFKKDDDKKPESKGTKIQYVFAKSTDKIKKSEVQEKK